MENGESFTFSFRLEKLGSRDNWSCNFFMFWVQFVVKNGGTLLVICFFWRFFCKFFSFYFLLEEILFVAKKLYRDFQVRMLSGLGKISDVCVWVWGRAYRRSKKWITCNPRLDWATRLKFGMLERPHYYSIIATNLIGIGCVLNPLRSHLRIIT